MNDDKVSSGFDFKGAALVCASLVVMAVITHLATPSEASEDSVVSFSMKSVSNPRCPEPLYECIFQLSTFFPDGDEGRASDCVVFGIDAPTCTYGVAEALVRRPFLDGCLGETTNECVFSFDFDNDGVVTKDDGDFVNELHDYAIAVLFDDTIPDAAQACCVAVGECVP